MRGGRFQQKAGEEASSRNAEGLFESRSVVDIREVETRMRKDIEEKKEELRQLVGASYRDLIESADSILDMKRSCEAVEANISRMEDGFDALHRSVADVKSTQGVDESREQRERLYAVGSRVKYLVDTPEKIWGCLDEHMYLEAAERYQRAREVHQLLLEQEGGDQRDVLALFPLLRHQWPLVETFQGQILQRSQERLQEAGLAVTEYATALSGAAIMGKLSSSSILPLFLDSRRAWLRSHLRLSRGISLALDTATLASLLSQLVRVIQVSLCQTGELFLEASSSRAPLLFSTLLAVTPATQLFGGIPQPERELALWKEQREALEERVTPLSGRAITEAALTWLQECAEDIAVDGQALIAQVGSAKGLAEIEAVVRAEIAKTDAFSDSMEWLATAFGTAPDSPWDCVCELVLKQPVNLWKSLFETLFTDRAKAIIDTSFASLSIAQQMDDSLAETHAPESSGDDSGESLQGTAAESTWQLPANERDWFSARASYFSPRVAALRDMLDKRLGEILEDMTWVMTSAEGGQGRAGELAPYLQERCFTALQAIAGELEAKLAELQAGGTADQATVVERALFVGRFCAALGQYSTYLPVLLGPPAAWGNHKAQDKASGHLGSRRSSDADLTTESARRFSRRGSHDLSRDESDSKLGRVQRRLRRVSVAAHRVWVKWSAEQLTVKFQKELKGDEALATTSPLKGWEETVTRQEEEGGQSVEMRMSLPAMPSAYALALLYAACREVHRVGSHTLDRAVLRLFAWSISQQILSIYESFVSDEPTLSSKVSEKGILQLLFDVRFLSDVLAGGSDIGPDGTISLDEDVKDPGTSLAGNKRVRTSTSQTDAAALARKRRVQGILEGLTGQIDPIDWATYEPYLWANERRYYNRCAVLFGSLIQLQRLYTDVTQVAAKNAESNTLNMAGAVPRFTYLPISSPLLANGSSSARSRRASLQPEGASASPWRAALSDDVSKFSFAEPQASSGLGAAKPLLKSIMGSVGSRFNENTFRLLEGQAGRLKDSLGLNLPGNVFSSLSGSQREQ